MEIGPDHELRVYARIVLDSGVGWEAKELAGRAVAAIARSHLSLLSRKASHVFEGSGDQVLRQIELQERALEMWGRYERTGDRATLLGELRVVVAGLESLS